MSDILTLSEQETEDLEMTPEILPMEARVSVTGSAEGLRKMFSSAVAVSPDKEIIKNTSFVLFEAFEGTLSRVSYCQVSATDGDKSIVRVNDTTETILAGSALLPGKRILDILKVAPSDTVRIDVNSTTVTIKSGRAVWTVAVPVEDYLAALPDFSEDLPTHAVPTARLKKSLETVLKAVATSAARLSLMQVQISGGRMTACDGARVHRVEVEEFPKELRTSIPSTLAGTLLKELAESTSETVYIQASDRSVRFHIGRNILSGQRLTVEYPDVDHLVLGPAMQNTDEMTVDPESLYSALKRVRINSDPEYHAVTLTLRQLKGRWVLIIGSRDRSGNTSQEVLEVDYSGSPKGHTLVLSHKLLGALLESLGPGDALFKLGESTKTKKAPVYVSKKSFTGVVMQMADNVLS